MPVQFLNRARRVCGEADTQTVGGDFRATDQAFHALPGDDADATFDLRFVDDFECGFHFHVRPPVG
ncbi:hypothetical protein D3C83_100850 [compost metagenome]